MRFDDRDGVNGDTCSANMRWKQTLTVSFMGTLGIVSASRVCRVKGFMRRVDLSKHPD